MSSEARKLSSKVLARSVEAAEPITSFAELAQTVATSATPYTVETPNDDIVTIGDGEVTIVCLAPSVWQEKARLKPFLEQALRPDVCLVFTGDAEALAGLPSDLVEAEVQSLCFPISTSQLALAIRNYVRLQRLVHGTEQIEQKVRETTDWVKNVFRISRELNGVRDTNKLLSLILLKAREITSADAGSIYTVEWHDEKSADGQIRFKITQNESVQQNLSEFQIPVSESSMVGSAVIHQTTINIPDLYALDPNPENNPFRAQHDRSWDEKLGYQCRSMLTLPMFDISHRVVGVIQLINRKKRRSELLKEPADFERLVIPFDEATTELAEIVAQQAGIALENALLTEEKEQLFEGFVHASVTAIEQRDPTTSGHSNRVAKLTVGLAEIISRLETGPYRTTHFSENQLKELEYASLLHDFGKLGVREQVLVKAKKLYPWQLELLLERFEHIRSRLEVEHLEELVRYLENPNTYPPGFGPESFLRKKEEKTRELDEFLEFILKANEPTVLEQGGFEKLKDIANLSFRSSRKQGRPYLLSEELKALSVSRGSLTREEFAEIQSHVTHTYEFLRKIPWGRTFANVPQIAAKHHEKLDGSGYPTSAGADEIPVQTRIMTISDIFDALTASDRPYKKAVPTEKALDIIMMDVKAGRCDADLFHIFVESKIYETVLENPRGKS